MTSSRSSALKDIRLNASQPRFEISEKVLCCYKSTFYEAKVHDIRLIGSAESPEVCQINYFIHYLGWNKSWDEWVSERRLLKYSEENAKLVKTDSTQQLHKNEENSMTLRNGNKKNSDRGSLKRQTVLQSTSRSSTSTQRIKSPAPKALSQADVMNPSNKSATLWTWEDVFSHSKTNKNGFPRAAPVSSFQNQKVPLANDWRAISIVGSVGEINMKTRLYARLPPAKKNGHKNKKGKIPYWFVEIVRFEGYIVKVRFLGYSTRPQETNFPPCAAQFRWIHFSQLKKLGYYSISPRKIGIASPPAFVQTLDEDIVLKALDDDLRGKVTVNPRNFEAVEQARTGMHDRWNSGSKVEVRNLDCCSEMRYGQVSKTNGQRVEVFYCDTGEHTRKSIWVHEDSEMIQPLGWTKTVGGKIQEFEGSCYSPSPLNPSALTVNQYPGIDIRVGMLFEFINPIKLDEISLGKVTQVLGYGFFHCKIESYMWSGDLVQYAGGENKFHYHISSDEIFPLGTFAGETPPPVPSDSGRVDYAENFDWETYLRVNGLKALDLPPKTEEYTPDFKDSMWVEAVDSLQPESICPAQIVKIVNPYALKIRFLGWNENFDQWKPIKSLDIYPVGWCQLNGYPLEPPPVSGSSVLECPVPLVTATEIHLQSVAAGASNSEMPEPEPEQGPSSMLTVPSSIKRLGLRSSNCISQAPAVSLQKSRQNNSSFAKRVRFQSFEDE